MQPLAVASDTRVQWVEAADAAAAGGGSFTCQWRQQRQPLPPLLTHNIGI